MQRWIGWLATGCIAFCGLLPLALGLRWLQLFIFTDYRAHHRPIIIPLGIIATTIGIALVFSPLWFWLGTVIWSRFRNRDAP